MRLSISLCLVLLPSPADPQSSLHTQYTPVPSQATLSSPGQRKPWHGPLIGQPSPDLYIAAPLCLQVQCVGHGNIPSWGTSLTTDSSQSHWPTGNFFIEHYLHLMFSCLFIVGQSPHLNEASLRAGLLFVLCTIVSHHLEPGSALEEDQ